MVSSIQINCRVVGTTGQHWPVLMLPPIKLTSKNGRMFTSSSASFNSQSHYSSSDFYKCIWYI